jgi:hypothetical protein
MTSYRESRRRFLQRSVAAAATMTLARDASCDLPHSCGTLVVNDDGYVFPNLNDDLTQADLRRYLETYCRSGVDTVAYCVGDMSWPTLYPSRVGVPYNVLGAGDDPRRLRIYKNVDRLAAEPGGYFGAAFAILHELGKTVLASFRMNDAHFTSLDNPNVSEFWKQNARLALGPAYGYYSGCLNYEHEEVRTHFASRVLEFADLYPEIDGIELDGMRSPFFFLPEKGPACAPLLTEMVRGIKAGLGERARRLQRPDYRLSINVPLTPELALTCGLDVAAWDAEQLFDYISVGTYQAYMQHPLERWKPSLVHGTPVLAYIGCSPQSGRYLGLEEYRAAAANAYGSGADGIYLFNLPCLFELAAQMPTAVDEGVMPWPDLRAYGHLDFSKVGQALDDMGHAESLRRTDKRFLFYFSNDNQYRHYDPDTACLDPRSSQGPLNAVFRCYEEYDQARRIVLRFKIENVARSDRFQVSLNGQAIEPDSTLLQYAANGRDLRIHTVALGPYLEYTIALEAAQLRRGDNRLAVAPTALASPPATALRLVELELQVSYLA